MTDLSEETFGALAAGTALTGGTGGNTTYDLISGSGAFTAITDGVRESAGRFAVGAGGGQRAARSPLGSLRSSLYARAYFRIPDVLPPAAFTLWSIRSGTTLRAELRMNAPAVGATAVNVFLRDQGALTGTPSAAVIGAGAYFRAEWHWDQTGNAQELRLWLGSNRDSTGPADVVLSGTAGGGTADNVNRGIITTLPSAFALDVDDDKTADTGWIGPSVATPPPPGPIGEVWAETFGALAAGTALTANGNTGYDLISQGGAGGTATAIADGVRGSGGRFAVGGTAGTVMARRPLADPEDVLFWRFYFRVPAAPAAHIVVAAIRNGTTALADLQVGSAGQLRLRNAGVLVPGGETATAPAAGVWHRAEWRWDRLTGQQELRVWRDPNREGTGAQTDTLTGPTGTTLPATNTNRGVGTSTTSWHVDFDDDAGSDADWLGPTTPAPTLATLGEGFEAGAPGDPVTEDTTDLTDVLLVSGGTATFDTLHPASGGQSAKLVCPSGTASVALRHDLGVLVSRHWTRAYFTLNGLPAAATVILTAKESAGSTVRAQVRVMTDGTLQLRNGQTAVATTTVAVAPGQLFRVEWAPDAGVEQRLRLFTGSNVHGASPDTGGQEIGGPMGAGTFDRLEAGNLTAGVLTTWVDEWGTSSTDWLGPTGSPVLPANRIHTGYGMPLVTVRGVTPPPPPPPGGELDALYAPIGDKVVWGATPGRLGAGDNTLANLSALEQMTGRRMDAIRIFYQRMDQTLFAPNSDDLAMALGDVNGGRLAVFSFKPAPWTIAEILAGQANTMLDARCADINRLDRPCIGTIGHEPEGPNGYDYPPADWRAMVIYVLNYLKARCPKFRSCVIFMGGAAPEYLAAAWGPNDPQMTAAVDWIGFDPYTFRANGAAPRPMSTIINTYMTWAEEGTKAGKPVLFAEYACADDPEGQNGAPITDAGRGKGAWMDATGAWFRDTARGRRVKIALYFHHPGTTPYQPVNSTTPSYTASSPTRSADPVLNSLSGWQRISAFPRTFVDLGF